MIVNDKMSEFQLVHTHSTKANLDYLVTMPKSNPKVTQNVPLIVFLHSLEERGTDLDLVIHNPKGQGLGLAGFLSKNQDVPVISLSPLCPKKAYWSFLHKRLGNLIEDVTTQLQHEEGIHLGPTLLSGVSMGGIGTWSMAMAYPQLFSDLIPIAGGVYSPPIIPRFQRIAHLPVLTFHDKNDPSIPYTLAEKTFLKYVKAGGKGELITYETGTHYIQEKAFAHSLFFSSFRY